MSDQRQDLCGHCGQPHGEEMPRYFMWKSPEAPDGQVIETVRDHKSLCRTKTQSFACCELVVPISGTNVELGFICWSEIAREDYEQILAFWSHRRAGTALPNWVSGTLANHLATVGDCFGTAVAFEVLSDDPTPYVKTAASDRTLSQILRGADEGFWHRFVAAFRQPS